MDLNESTNRRSLLCKDRASSFERLSESSRLIRKTGPRAPVVTSPNGKRTQIDLESCLAIVRLQTFLKLSEPFRNKGQ